MKTKPYIMLIYPNAMRCPTSKACQCSSGLKYVCTSKEFVIRMARQTIKIFIDDEKISQLGFLFPSCSERLRFPILSLSSSAATLCLCLIFPRNWVNEKESSSKSCELQKNNDLLSSKKFRNSNCEIPEITNCILEIISEAFSGTRPARH